jgi:hypothetical protein
MTRSLHTPFSEHADEESTAFVLVAHGPAVQTNEVEEIETDALEVRVFWERSLLSTHYLESEGAIVIGDHEDSIARIPEIALGRAALEVVRTTAIGFVVQVPRGTVARVERGETDGDVAGPREWETSRGDRIEMAFGSFRLELVHGCAGRRVPRMSVGERLRQSATLQVVGAALLHTALFGAFAYYTPALFGEDDASAAGRSDQIWLMRQYLGAAAERERDRIDQPQVESPPGASDPSGGSRASGPEGTMGKEGAPVTHKRWGKFGPTDNSAPALGPRGSTLPQGFEMIGVVAQSAGDPDAPSAPWGRLDALGSDPMSALGGMWGATIGETAGVGGLGLTGTGQGGDGHSEWVGLDLNDLGGRLVHGWGIPGGGNGPGGIGRGGSCPGCQLTGHVTKGPSMRPGETTLKGGHMPPEVIQRIVHDNFGRFRNCYEAGLRGNPSLEGRVVTRFAIDRRGAVTTAQDGGSSLPNTNVVECVVRSFYSLSFPEHEGGIVTVVYPLALRPE